MFIKKLLVQNFRNFREASFSFGPGMNCIWGENGSGKSNLLEALFFAATGRPSKAARDGELIHFGEGVGRVEVLVEKRKSELILEAALDRIEKFSARKVLKFNRQPVRKLSELIGQVKVVLFTPHDEAIVQGEPSFRRRFLDLALSQISSSYLHHLQQYQMVREQRNNLLKRPHTESELTPWNIQLVETGSHLILKRLEFLPLLSPSASFFHARLSEGETLSLSYQSSVRLDGAQSHSEIARAFEASLARTAFEESQRGTTLVGPHRDDLEIFLNGIDARLFGSQGQQKAAALSLKLAEGELFEQAEGGEPPVYLLDDCFSELDSSRQEALRTIFRENSQSILTMAVKPPPSFSAVQLFKLEPATCSAIECAQLLEGSLK